jgi:hypothetical protein
MGASALLLDGHWDASGDWGGLIFVPSVEETQEFKIQTNAFSPQYGWSMGNAVNVVTKSGADRVHGGAFEFLRNGHLDANNFFANKLGLGRPLVHRNQFGFNLGGPLWIPGLYRQRNRTFIFGSFEGLRQQTPITAILSVPTVQQRQGDFSQTFNANGSVAVLYNPFTTRQQANTFVRDPFPGNQIPLTMIDPVASKLLPFFPQPNRPGTLTGSQNFVGATGLPLTGDQYTVRVDHKLTEDQRLFLRWSQKRQFIQGVGPYFGVDNPGGMGTSERDPRWDTALGYSYAITSQSVITATAGWNRWVLQLQPQGVPFQPSSLGLPASLDAFGGTGGFPTVSVDGITGLGAGSLTRIPREARTFSLDASHIRGRHTVTAGFMALDFRVNTYTSSVASFSFPRAFTQGPDPTRGDPTSGAGVASLLLGTGSGGGITLAANAAYHKTFYGWYLNDDFRFRRNLTLNLGIRYDFQTAPSERFDRIDYWTLARNSVSDAVGQNLLGALQHTGGGGPRGVYDPQYTNLAPRVGLSYSPLNRLVIRTGFGIFYTPAMEFGVGAGGGNQGLTLDGFSQTTPYVGSLDNNVTPHDLLRNPFPNGMLSPPGRASGDRTNLGLSINAVERDRPTPYVEQWTFGLQYQIASETVLEAAYTGNLGVKLLFGTSFQLNQLTPAQLSLGNTLLQPVANPFFGTVTAGPLSGPTVPRERLLRPYPQFDSVIAVQPPAGMSNYNALMVSANHRFRHGLHFQVSFTASKYLTNTEGFEGNVSQNPAQQVRNYYNIAVEKSLMNDDTPRSLVANYIYELPVGKGRKFAPASRFVDGIIGRWQIAGISTFRSGFPLAILAVTNNTNSLGGNQRPNLVGIPASIQPTPDRWFNTGVFAQPLAFTFGNVPRTMPNLRSQGTNNFDVSAQKYWHFRKEQTKLQIRCDFFNLFNRTAFYQPDTFFGDPGFGQVSQAYPARSTQLGLKLYW